MLQELTGDDLSEEERRRLTDVLRPFEISDELLDLFCRVFTDDLEKGLKKASNREADLKCFPTYVSKMPTGRESGRYLALDLGGTHFRVLLVDLDAKDLENDTKFKTFDVPSELMVGSVHPLFDHIATCISQFVKDEGLQDEELFLGFTFSFLCRQLTLTNAILERLSKGFNYEDAYGKNVYQLLTDAIEKRKDTKVKCVAIINDTTGTLIACAFRDPETAVGLIFGTGTNACFIEKLSQAEMWNPEEISSDVENGILNCEWGAFGDGGCLDENGIRNDFDRRLDAATNNVGGHLFEKMVSGKYLGEIVRLVLARIHQMGLIFKRQETYVLNEEKGRMMFLTKFLSDVESEGGADFRLLRRVLDEIGIRLPSRKDCEIVRAVCQAVSTRSARLAGAAAASLINHMGRPAVTVGIDGSLYRFHPTFHVTMDTAMKQLVRPGLSYKTILSSDGSGRGAALVAAAAVKTQTG